MTQKIHALTATGRFLNADGLVSTGQGLLGYNMYAYCNNNPVNRVDFGGNISVPVVIAIAVGAFVAGVVVGAVVGAVVGGYVVSQMPSKEEHYARNELNRLPTEEEFNDIASGNTNENWIQADDKVNKYHRFTNGIQGEEAIYNKKYVSGW